mgnify:CR=1 FL=1
MIGPPYDPDYQSLRSVLCDAYEQAASGKGKERHGNGLPFEQQPMQTISGLLDSDRGMYFQAIKKIQEASRMDGEARDRELLGAINYVCGVIVFHRSKL